MRVGHTLREWRVGVYVHLHQAHVRYLPYIHAMGHILFTATHDASLYEACLLLHCIWWVLFISLIPNREEKAKPYCLSGICVMGYWIGVVVNP